MSHMNIIICGKICMIFLITDMTIFMSAYNEYECSLLKLDMDLTDL